MRWKEHEDGMVTWMDKIYVPKDKSLREKIIRLHHDLPSAGHSRRYKTQELVTRNYWWPRMQGDIQKYVTGCQVCQRTKPLSVDGQSWTYIDFDFGFPYLEILESHGVNSSLLFTTGL